MTHSLKIKVKGQLFKMWSGNKRTDRRTDTTENITFSANAVGKMSCLSSRVFVQYHRIYVTSLRDTEVILAQNTKVAIVLLLR